jgi:hypothetical protein
MKRFIIQYKLIALVLLITGFSSMGQPYEKSRCLSKSFFLEPQTEVEVSNKYGDIQLVQWEKDSVKFDIEFKVIATKESKLNSTFDYVDFDFNATKSYVIVETTFAGQGTFWSDVKDLANTVFAGGTKTQIDYKIYVPVNTSVKIENKYGDVLISDHNGQMNIALSNGNLKANELNGKSDIKLQFANANIKLIKNGDFDLSYYSELELDEADDLKIESRSSRISIEQSNNLELISTRDKYYLETVNNIEARNSFTYLEIKNLKNQIDLNANYGELVIKTFDDSVNKILLDVESTEMSIFKDESQNIKLDLIYNERAGIYFSDDLKNKKTEKVDEEKRLVKTTGILGNNTSKAIILRANILSGKLKINNR